MGVIKPYTKKDGKKYYMIKFYIGVDPLTGKTKESSKRGFKNPTEAKTALARIELSIREGTYQKPRVETYQDVYNLWVVQYERKVEESTFVKTTGIFKNHILPLLGEYKIDKINVDICQKAVNKWADDLVKFRAVKYYAALVMDFAIKHEYIKKDPFALVDMAVSLKKKQASKKVNKENFYTREQLIEFLTCFKKENNVKAYTLFRLLAFSGMRKGEALALTWNDIDFKNNEILINKALSRGKVNQLYVKSTKTGVVRAIKMDKHTMAILKNWRKKQKEDYLILGFNTMRANQLVFSNEQNEFMQPTKTRKWILHVQKKYGLETITTHGLRHTHCSLLFEAGATIKEVQDRLGHSDVKTTMNIYAHVTKKAKEAAIQKFESYLNIDPDFDPE